MKKIIYTFTFLLTILSFKLVAQTWKEVGTGNNALKANGIIYSLTKDNLGNIYAAGYFNKGFNNYYVAKWNGSTWSELGTGVNSLKANYGIISIISDKLGNVYAAGQFTNLQGFRYVAKWDGIHWTELGGTSNNSLKANADISGITIDKLGNIYAGGVFTDSLTSTKGKCYVAKWNGTTWSKLGIGSNALNPNHWILSVATDSLNNVYAGGYFTDSLTINKGHEYIAKWDGTSWNELGTGTNALNAAGGVLSITVDKFGAIYSSGKVSAGIYNVCRWDGTSWNIIGTGTNALNANNRIGSIGLDGIGNLYATGGFTDSIASSNGRKYIAKWDGTSWSKYGILDSTNWLGPILIDNADNVYTTGSFLDSLGYNYVAKYSTTTGIFQPKLSYNNLEVYPNPCKSVINVKSLADCIKTIEVSNLLGQVVQSGHGLIVEPSANYQLKTDDLPSGIYFLKAIDVKGNQQVVKFVKE